MAAVELLMSNFVLVFSVVMGNFTLFQLIVIFGLSGIDIFLVSFFSSDLLVLIELC